MHASFHSSNGNLYEHLRSRDHLRALEGMWSEHVASGIMTITRRIGAWLHPLCVIRLSELET